MDETKKIDLKNTEVKELNRMLQKKDGNNFSSAAALMVPQNQQAAEPIMALTHCRYPGLMCFPSGELMS